MPSNGVSKHLSMTQSCAEHDQLDDSQNYLVDYLKEVLRLRSLVESDLQKNTSTIIRCACRDSARRRRIAWELLASLDTVAELETWQIALCGRIESADPGHRKSRLRIFVTHELFNWDTGSAR